MEPIVDDAYAPSKKGLPEVAFYYPNPYWQNADWAKNLVLFFDGVATLIPNYMPQSNNPDNESIIEGLKEHGLFHVLEPENVVDAEATKQLATLMTEVITSGALDGLSRDETDFGSISMSRLGFRGDLGLADMIFDELKRKGLAKDSKDGVSIPMHPMVRGLVLTLLAQILRPQGEKLGLDLEPATDRPSFVRSLEELLSLPNEASAGHVVSFDLQTVGVDLGSVPMGEILDYRKEHQKDYRTYTLSVKKFVRELSEMPEEERTDKFEERQDELNGIAAQLRKHSRRAWRKPASFAMTIAGAGIAIYTGNPGWAVAGGFTRLFGAIFGGVGHEKLPALGPYSFLFKANERFDY